jgi:parallel beta-helix repeat protein
MFFLSLFLFVFCFFGTSVSANQGAIQGAIQEAKLTLFDDLAKSADQQLHDEQLALSLQSLQKLVQEESSPVSAIVRKIQTIKTHLAALVQTDANQRAVLRARQESDYSENMKLLAKIRTELGRLEAAYQQKASTHLEEGPPSTICSPTIPITAVPFTIAVSGHYCLQGSFSGVTVAPFITITASNVELSFDTNTLSNGSLGILIQGVSNVTISGMGTLSNMQTGILVQDSDAVSIADMVMTSMSDAGILVQNSEATQVKNCYFSSSGSGVFTTGSTGLKITSSDFTTCTTALALDSGTTEIGAQNCFFDENSQDIVTPGTAQGGVSALSIDSCFLSNASGGDSIQLTSSSQVSLSRTFICNVSSGNALSVTDSTDILVADCQILLPSENGIFLQGTTQNVSIRDSSVLNAQMSAVMAQGISEGLFLRSIFAASSTQACTALKVSQCTSILVSECVCNALCQNPETVGTNGVVFDAVKSFSLTDCQVETNARSQDDSSGSSLFLTNGCVGGIIKGCTFSSIQPNVANFAIFALGENHSLCFTDNTIDGAYRSGFRLDGTKFSKISNNSIQKIQEGSGITLKNALGVAVIGNRCTHNKTHGIHLDKESKQCFVYGNTLLSNHKNGIKNNTDGDINKIYHNFAMNNHESNYFGVHLVAGPSEHVGALENISN